MSGPEAESERIRKAQPAPQPDRAGVLVRRLPGDAAQGTEERSTSCTGHRDGRWRGRINRRGGAGVPPQPSGSGRQSFSCLGTASLSTPLNLSNRVFSPFTKGGTPNTSWGGGWRVPRGKALPGTWRGRRRTPPSSSFGAGACCPAQGWMGRWPEGGGSAFLLTPLVQAHPMRRHRGGCLGLSHVTHFLLIFPVCASTEGGA